MAATILALFLRVITLFCIPVACHICDTSRDINPNSNLIGEPVRKIETGWESLNQTSSVPIIYRVYYFKTSRFGTCSCKTWHNLVVQPQCTLQSSQPGQELRCVLKEDTIKSLNITFFKGDTICIVVEGSYLNSTWYNFADCSTPIDFAYCTSTCPAPDKIQVSATKNRTLTVTFDVSKYVRGKGLLNIGFHIFYRPVRRQTNGPKEFQKITLRNDIKKFTVTNNRYDILNLEPSMKYEVQICCFYNTQPDGRCPHSVSYFASTLEEAPIRAPVVSEAELQENNLLVKLQLPPPSSRNGHLVRYEIEVWQGSNDCIAIYPKRIINGNITRKDITRSSSNVRVWIDKGGKCCFRINICTVPGCSPWSRAHFVQSRTTDNPNLKTNIPQGQSYATVIAVACAVVGLLSLVFIMTLIYRCKFGNRSRQHQIPLPVVIEVDEDSQTSTTDIEDHPSDDNIYAAVVQDPGVP